MVRFYDVILIEMGNPIFILLHFNSWATFETLLSNIENNLFDDISSLITKIGVASPVVADLLHVLLENRSILKSYCILMTNILK